MDRANKWPFLNRVGARKIKKETLGDLSKDGSPGVSIPSRYLNRLCCNPAVHCCNRGRNFARHKAHSFVERLNLCHVDRLCNKIASN